MDFSKGIPLGSNQLDNYSFLESWVADCISAVELNNGAFHLEGILHNNEMYFLEIGARAGGANVVNCTEYLTGINLMREEIKIRLHKDKYVLPEINISNNRYGWFVIKRINTKFTNELINYLDSSRSVIYHTINIDNQENNNSYDAMSNHVTGILSASDSENTLVKETNKILKNIWTL